MRTERHVADTAALRAMSHPLRLRLYYALTIAGSATATALAHRIGESASLVSYHLRQLAEFGYVTEDAGPAGADGRERWWRPTSVGFMWSAADFGEGSDGAMAVAEAIRQVDAHQASYRQDWLDAHDEWDQEWRDNALTADNPLLRMTPGELRDFGAEYLALVEKWRAKTDASSQRGGRAERRREQIMLVLHAFPFRP